MRLPENIQLIAYFVKIMFSQIDFETSNIETAQSLVASGLGVTIVPKMVMRQNANVNPLYIPLQSYPTRTVVFAYLKDRYLSLAARAFMDAYDRE
ncbi:LysR family transcriptional regulator substrate-binding protein [Neobacillus citreus]|uniref:LysR family transcriptional regulator substrate-binding protein n=1 Tax=Neobacillus citreus TaxID=2833578 RepID=A0A942TB86_9BACI|nr:LysR family transcriptional regulator substrate-binding protein [Neobacillus citreus]MCH6266956.1 LysR family transcriptional regulator substrate-binding protein [Neobacillus citreus]